MTAFAAATPGYLALAPALLAASLAGLWFGPRARLVVPLALGCALMGVSGWSAPAGLGAGVATLALAGCACLIARCVDLAAAAQSQALQTAVTRDHDIRAAERSQQELAGQLHYWSTHDALTGLLNRTAFLRLVESTLSAGHAAGVFVVSLAGFTATNEQHGDRFGDSALTEFAGRLGAAARGGDITARLGGDTFGVLLAGLPEHTAPTVGGRLLQALDQPFTVADDSAVLRARSALAVVAAGTSVTGRTLLRAAEAAARAATAGSPPAVVAGDAQPLQADTGLTEADLARGIDSGELFLLYQPLVSGRTGLVTGVEALVRWAHPVHGLVPPDAFIGLAERTGLILPLGMQVLKMACVQLGAWAETAPHLTVAVNVSARQLVEPGFVEDVRRVLWGTRVDPARLVLELTESLLVDDSEAAVAVLWQLRGLGVRLALDDFGTGYSSLSRLGDLPLDEMKIDKSFVDRLGSMPQDSATLVTAAVAMGHGLNLEVVAEGVETEAQAAFLRDIGCDLLQGYLFGKPQPAADIRGLLNRSLLPLTPHIPAAREDQDRMFVPAVMPSLQLSRRGR